MKSVIFQAGESLEKVRAATTEAKALAKKEMFRAAKAQLQLEDDPGEIAVVKARQLVEEIEEKAGYRTRTEYEDLRPWLVG